MSDTPAAIEQKEYPDWANERTKQYIELWFKNREGFIESIASIRSIAAFFESTEPSDYRTASLASAFRLIHDLTAMLEIVVSDDFETAQEEKPKV